MQTFYLIFGGQMEKIRSMQRKALILFSLAISLFGQEIELEKERSLPQRGFIPTKPRADDSDRDPVMKNVYQDSSSTLKADSILPPGRACQLENPGGIHCLASFLLWQSKMWGVEFIGKSEQPTGAGSAAVSLKEKVFVPDFAWRPGFKIDLGYDLNLDGWDTDSRWTFYKGHDTSLKKSFSSQIHPPGMGLIPLWFYPFYNVLSPNQIRFSDGTMRWKIYFNSIDLEIGRLSKVAKHLSVRLFGGVKGAWMRQFYKVDYQKGSTISAIVPGIDGTVTYELLKSAAVFKNKTWGGGPRVGMNSKWNLRWGLSLIADASVSLLYSKIETRRDQNDLNFNSDSSEEELFHVHMKSDSHQLKPVAEAKLGLDWATCIYSHSTIGWSIAYEIQYWWAQNELRRNYSHATPGNQFPSRGDLQMHGLTAEVFYSY